MPVTDTVQNIYYTHISQSGWTPKHHCRQEPLNSTNYTEVYEEGLDSCKLTLPDNSTQTCPYGWVYKGNPESEWSIVSEVQKQP